MEGFLEEGIFPTSLCFHLLVVCYSTQEQRCDPWGCPNSEWWDPAPLRSCLQAPGTHRSPSALAAPGTSPSRMRRTLPCPAWLTPPPSGPLLRGGCLGELSGCTSFSGPSLEPFSLLPAPGQVRSPRGDWLGMPGDGSTEPTPSRPPAPCFWPCLLLQVSCPSTGCPLSMDAHPSQPQLKPQVSASSAIGTTRTGSEASCAPHPVPFHLPPGRWVQPEAFCCVS